MNGISAIDAIKQKYIDENLESSKKISYTDLLEKDGVITALYKDLHEREINGYPIGSDFVSKNGKTYSCQEFSTLSNEEKENCDLRYYYLPYSHELYVGTTGSGKTTGCVEPQLRAITTQKNKPNLFITDPKGELFDRNARHLKEEGYKLFVVNFKDLVRTDKWNPLLELYDLKMETTRIGEGVKMRTGKVDKKLELVADEKDYGVDGYVEYKGKAYPDGESYEEFLRFEKDYIEANIDSILNQIVNMIITVQSKTDRSWELGAQDMLRGIIQCMLDDAANNKDEFTRDMMSFKTIQQYYLAIRNHVLGGKSSLREHPLMKNRSAKIISLLSTGFDNAPNTMRSYCGVFDNSTQDWFQGHIFALTTGNTIELDNLGDTPFAIFLITRDYEKSDFLIAGLFIDWIYRKMIEKAEKSKKPKALHFMLEEFGNIPAIKDLENKISTSRSRNIWFHLVVQSYQQIDAVYGETRSVIIRDNCNSQIFLGAQNRDTKTIFSRECGNHFISTLNSKLDPRDNSLQEVPLVPISDLELITPGEMYLKRLYMPVIITQFMRSYVCADMGVYNYYKNADGLLSCTPKRIESFTGEKYTYKRVFDILEGKNNGVDDDMF